MEFNEEDFIDNKNAKKDAYDESDFVGESRSFLADGGDFTRPINQVPEGISLLDRAKLSVGNDVGKINYLKTKFSDAKKLPNSGDFVVKDTDNLWKRVDKDGMGFDGWEIAADIVDSLPTLGAIGAQIGVGLATGGTSLPAQAFAAGRTGMVTKGIETVLGKIVGTYDDSDANMLKDIATEGLLNIGGTVVAAGVKPTAKLIANGLRKAGAVLSNADDITKDGFATVLGNSFPSGSRTVHTIIDHPGPVGSAIEDIGRYSIPADAAKQIQMDAVERIVKATPHARNEFYGKALEQDVIANLPKGFKNDWQNLKKGVEETFFGNAGYTKVTETGKTVLKSFDDIVKNPIVKNKLGEDVIMSLDEADYNVISELWKTIENTKNVPSRVGTIGAKDLLDQRRQLTGTAYKLASKWREVNPKAAELAGKFAASVKQVLGESFRLEKEVPINFKYVVGKNPKTGLDVLQKVSGAMSRDPLGELDLTYHTIKGNLEFFEGASKAILGDSNKKGIVLEGLVNQMMSKSGTKVSAKQQLDSVFELLSEFGGQQGKLAAKSLQDIKVYNAAKESMPIMKPGILTTMAGPGAVSAGVSGNPATAMALASAGALTSPRMTSAAVRATSAAVRSSMNAVNFIKGLTPKAKTDFLKNPKAVMHWVNTVTSQPGLRESVTNQLMHDGLRPIIDPMMGRGGQR
jgi:hypothetical protein